MDGGWFVGYDHGSILMKQTVIDQTTLSVRIHQFITKISCQIGYDPGVFT